MLVGPHAPLVLDRGVRATYMRHVYDFYKPDMSSEYPVVDAKLSIQCYLSALDHCYAKYRLKAEAKGKGSVSLNSFDGVLFHSPYCKLVQKSLARLSLNDYLALAPEQRMSQYPELAKFQETKLEESYFDRDLEKAFMAHSSSMFEAKTRPGLKIATNVGNMYTPSLYGGLVSYLSSQSQEQLAGRNIALFSYGSGLASSFFSMQVSSDIGPDSALSKLLACLSDVQHRLDERVKVSPENFVTSLGLREAAVDSAPFTPQGPTSELFPGTWYLVAVDEKHRRTYDRVPLGATTNGHA